MLKDLIWVGDTKNKIRKFPKEVCQKIGDALRFAQMGEKYPIVKPFKGLVLGVFEIVCRFNTDTYRGIYSVKLGSNIYVLHIFQKKSKSGIKTPQKEIELIKKRLQVAIDIEEGIKK